MISVFFQLTKTFGPWLLELVSMYIKLSPIGDSDVAPLFLDGLFLFVDRKKFCILPAPFLSLHLVTQFCKR